MQNANLIGGWHDLYVMLGTSSAALIGLLFVALSLHLRQIASNRLLQGRARNSMLHLVVTLVQAIAILTPQTNFFRGFEITAASGFGLVMSFTLAATIVQPSVIGPDTLCSKMALIGRELIGIRPVRLIQDGRSADYSIWRGRMHVFGILLAGAGGILLMTQARSGLYFVTISYGIALVLGIWNAWKQALLVSRSGPPSAGAHRPRVPRPIRKRSI